jgi:5'-nucleotidase (lipoprotein e(P4) family)
MNRPMTRIPAFLLVVLAACSAPQKTVITQSAPAAAVSVQGKLYTSVYQQSAAEYKALCFQAYNIARLHVDEWRPGTKPTAIVTDIDETLLDNSPYDARQALQGKDYDQKTWEEWTAKGQADTVPGAPSFLKYAASKGIEVFYITNRYESERTGTLRNLQNYNFPNADNAHLILRQPSTSSSKEQRRQQVLQTHNILMLLGDNLADFSVLYDKKTLDERNQTTQQLASEFGNRFIVLPNPVYGDWESALYRYNYGLTPAQKDSVLKATLKTY